MSRGLEVLILGPLEVLAGGEPRAIRGAKQRKLLALLVLNAGETVAADRLIDGLWDENPPAGALNTLQVHLSQLRKVMGRDVVVTQPPGYLLRIEPDAVDAVRFERLVAEGAGALAAGDPAQARLLLGDALALWRGQPLADVAYERFAQAEIVRLEELRLDAIEDRLEADLALGRHVDILGETESLVMDHPLRERLRGQLMLALYRAGRQTEALDAYQEGRRILLDELGLEPGPELHDLERKILVHDPSLNAPERRPVPTSDQAPRAVRKTVTISAVELRLVGEGLDPEARDAVTVSALGLVADAIERHSGTVSGRTTHALTAVFGVPVAHEDDALRAVRAAAEFGSALETFSAELEQSRGVALTSHTGLDTGTALAGPTLSGEVVDNAQRLARLAEPGETLLPESTRQLVSHAVNLEAASDVFRIAGQPEDFQRPRRLGAPMVGRQAELAGLVEAIEVARNERRPRLVTVLGPAGIGKSRLMRELAACIEGEATVLIGRSPSYGDATSFRPLGDVIAQAAGDATVESIAALLEGDGEARTVADRLAVDAAPSDAHTTTEEIFWAARRLFEHLARSRPLVLVFEDVHWAAGSFLSLIESVVELSRESPIVVVCLARPDLLETRPGWGERADMTKIALEPLAPEDAEALVVELAGTQLSRTARARVIETAEGNPLFLEQLLASLSEGDDPGEAFDLPPTIEALIAERLDRLDGDERDALERAAVVGKELGAESVAALAESADDPAVRQLLERLVDRGFLVQLDDPHRAGYRFHHVLVRETAYHAIPKAVRADLHERHADWLISSADDGLAEREAIVGSHLEAAFRLRREIDGRTEHGVALSERAARHLSAAGRRAYALDDSDAAVSLLTRAVALIPENSSERLDPLFDLGEAARESGSFDVARKALEEAVERSRAEGDAAREAGAQVVLLRIRMQVESEFASDDVLREIDETIEVLEQAGDNRALARAWSARAWIPWLRCHAEETGEALERAMAYAKRAGDQRTEAHHLTLILGVALFGPAPVTEAVARCDAVVQHPATQRRTVAAGYRALAGLHAMEGRFDEARELLERDRAMTDELGLHVAAAAASEVGGILELLAGDPEAAERRLRDGYEILEEMGERSALSNLAPMLAKALHAQGRSDEALRYAELGEEFAPPDDRSAQVQWRAARALILASRGEAAEAEALAREAATLAEDTDFLNLHGDALTDLADVLRLAGRRDDAAAIAERALALYERKGNAVAAARVRAENAARAL